MISAESPLATRGEIGANDADIGSHPGVEGKHTLGRKRQPSKKRQHKNLGRPSTPINLAEVLKPRILEPKKQYGRPFILMEDANLNTFHYVSGSWVPHDKRIAECRVDCQVTALPQKVNNMTRYEVRPPIE